MFSNVCHILLHFKGRCKFTVVKPLVIGTEAAIDALLVTPHKFFSSYPSVLADFEEYGAKCLTGANVCGMCMINIFRLPRNELISHI